MHIILGGTGHIGSALARELLRRGEPVTVVTRSQEKAALWGQRGARAAVVDVHEVAALQRVFRQGKRLFLLNPPADPSTDTAAEERRSLESILAALAGSGLEKVVAQSTYGAQPGERIGDLGVLHEMEQKLAAQPIPTTVIQAAYYMSNWDSALETAQKDGQVHTFFPVDFRLPMVAPSDIAQLAARLLLDPAEPFRIHAIEGPETCSPADVARAFAAALRRPVEAVSIPRERWTETLQQVGFSPPAAQSMAAMTALTLAERYQPPASPERGPTTLQEYVQGLVDPQAAEP